MKREFITIEENGNVHVPTTSIWMSACEIADYSAYLRQSKQPHQVYLQRRILREDEVMQTLLFKGGAVDLYNIEMITMLSFSFCFSTSQKFP